MSKRYKDEVYVDSIVHMDCGCAVRGCDRPISKHYTSVFITVAARPRTVSFCDTHGPYELESEALYKKGL